MPGILGPIRIYATDDLMSGSAFIAYSYVTKVVQVGGCPHFDQAKQCPVEVSNEREDKVAE